VGGRGSGGRDPSNVPRLATLVRAIAALLALCLVVVAGVGVYAALGDLSAAARFGTERWDAPVSDDQTRQTFVVSPGQSAVDIGSELSARGLIRSPLVFRLLVEARGVGNQIESGEYHLSPAMSTNEMISVLSHGASRSGVTLTIPEGWRAEQTAQKLEALGLSSAADFLALVHNPGGLELPDSIPAGQSIEGYLFPDTYDIAKDADARKLAQMMVRQFDRKLNPQLRQRAAGNGLFVHQVVTLASIVEREAARPAEQPIIASVYLNRLNNNMPLQADPTIQFAVATADPARALEIGFWKRELTRDDLQVSSAYNTYLIHGLPPGPICSPGLDAVEAVLNPSQTDYYYFVARGDGSHAFARTEAEHRANVERHQASQ